LSVWQCEKMYNNAIMYQDIKQSLDSIFPDFNKGELESIPCCDKLNENFEHQNGNNKKLIFCTQDKSLPHPKLGYEQRIYQKGIIATRKNNWHDFFNAMVWHNFPKIKSSINAIHHKEIEKQSDNIRSRKRDLLTLFDECGVIVIANKQYLDMIRNHNWKELFIEHKNAWLNLDIKVITFGHAMFEKYLNPYIGMTAQSLLFESMENPMDDFISDGILNQHLLLSKTELSPLPMLGIPEWYTSQSLDFYNNKNYFR